jgi:CRISPR system Cascade subunit CasE
MPFRLRANTVVTRDGKRLGLVREDALRDWLLRRAESIGAEFLGFDVADEGYSYGKQGGNNGKSRRLAFKAARFDGRLRVRDPELFAQKLAQGVGPAKGFGHGLLSVRYPR